MAETLGIVQKLVVISSSGLACTWIGPTPTDAELLFVQRDASETPAQGAFENSMVDTLAAAMTNRRQVAATHGDNDARITSLRIDPV